MRRLRTLDVNNNAHTGSLPGEWGANDSFPSLLTANLVSRPALPVVFARHGVRLA